MVPGTYVRATRTAREGGEPELRTIHNVQSCATIAQNGDYLCCRELFLCLMTTHSSFFVVVVVVAIHGVEGIKQRSAGGDPINDQIVALLCPVIEDYVNTCLRRSVSGFSRKDFVWTAEITQSPLPPTDALHLYRKPLHFWAPGCPNALTVRPETAYPGAADGGVQQCPGATARSRIPQILGNLPPPRPEKKSTLLDVPFFLS